MGRLAPLPAAGLPPVRAIAFDAFPIFDPRPAFGVLSEQFPGRGDQLRRAWFTKLFAYTWLRTSGERYVPFDAVMGDALQAAADDMGIAVSPQQQSVILGAFRALPVWDDVRAELGSLRESGVRTAFLSNMTEDMLRANLRHNHIEELFDFTLSTDRAGAFKPAPEAYQLAVETFGLDRSEIGFAAFAGWDAAGASWFGYRSAWVNRLGATSEKLDAEHVIEGRDLSVLRRLISADHGVQENTNAAGAGAN